MDTQGLEAIYLEPPLGSQKDWEAAVGLGFWGLGFRVLGFRFLGFGV